MWVCRAGKKATFEKYVLTENRIFLPWEGFDTPSLPKLSLNDIRSLVGSTMKTENRTSISNWSGQLYSFVNEMKINDYVMIPSQHSIHYTLATITGEYEYNAVTASGLQHSHTIEILYKNIPRDIFSQSLIYSLGAFRTVFKIRQEDEALSTIKKWNNERTQGK